MIIEALNGQPVEASGLFVREGGGRAFPRAPRVLDGLGHITARCRLVEVVCELGEMRLRVRRIETLQHLAYLAVESHAARARERAVQGLADERMREDVATRG